MSLREATFSATRWTTAATVSRAALQIAQTMVLARLLAPQDFGLMAMAGVATAITALFADFGLGSALMHFPSPDRRTFSTIYWLNLGISCCFTLLFTLLAWPVSRAYGQADLQPVLSWLGLIFPLCALGLPFRTIAEKDLRFSVLAGQEIVAAMLGFLVALAVAFAGGGVFALVAAALATATASSALAWLSLSTGLFPAREFSLSKARPFLSFGLHRVGASLWSTLSMQADVLIAGLNASPSGTAFYSVPREYCLRISNAVINPVVTRVGLPVMTRLQHELTALRSVYLQTLRMTASLNFPVYALLAMFPEQIVGLLLGDQWLESAFYLRLFAVWGLIRSTGNPSGSLVYAVGMVTRAHIVNLIVLVGTVPLLWVAAKSGGLVSLAWTMCALQCIVFAVVWRFLIHPACGATFVEYSAQLAPPLVTTVLASTLSLVATQSLAPLWKLPVGALLFGSAYILLSWRLNRSWLNAMIELAAPVRKLLARRR